MRTSSFSQASYLKHLEDDVPDPGLGEGLCGALPHEAEQVPLHVLEDEVEARVFADHLCVWASSCILTGMKCVCRRVT